MIIITNDGLQRRDTDVFGLTWLQDWKQRETASQALVELNNCESQDCAFCFVYPVGAPALALSWILYIYNYKGGNVNAWHRQQQVGIACPVFFFFFYPDAAPMSAGLSTCMYVCVCVWLASVLNQNSNLNWLLIKCIICQGEQLENQHLHWKLMDHSNKCDSNFCDVAFE